MTMETYKVTTYNDKATYTVRLDLDTGTVESDDLDADSLALLQYSVRRHMTSNRLSAVVALGKSIGPYSFLSEAVADPTPEPGVV